MTEMQEVLCPDCGTSLGYQGPGDIQYDYWQHARCPVRSARRLGLTRQEYDMAVQIASIAVYAAYPDFPNSVLASAGSGPEDTDEVRQLRARIAAEMVLERLGGRYSMAVHP